MILRAAAGGDVAGRRLDDAVRLLFPRLSRTLVRRVIDWGGVRVGGAVVRVASRAVRPGEEIVVGVAPEPPDVGWTLVPDRVLYEDAAYLAVDKPAGVYAQRTPYQLKGTVEFAAAAYLKARGGSEPVRIVHRLDRGTSGAMVLPKTRGAAARLSADLAGGRVEKVYWALVPRPGARAAWTEDAPIAPAGSSSFAVDPGGREARTSFRVLSAGAALALVEARPLTGRTHQIRVHLAHGGVPVLGDDRYGGSPAPRMMLHSRSIAFALEDGRPVTVCAPPDEVFRRALAGAGIDLPVPGAAADIRGEGS